MPSKPLTTDVFSDVDLKESRDRLKRAGAFLLVSSEHNRARLAKWDSKIPAGYSLWTPEEMFSYVMAKPKARTLIRELKQLKPAPGRLV